MTVTTNVDLITAADGVNSPFAKGLGLTNSAAAPGNSISLGATEDAVQFYTPTADISLNLDNTHKAGRAVHIFNQSPTKVITIVAADLSVIRAVYPLTYACVVPIVDSPTATTQWLGMNRVTSNWLVVPTALSLVDAGNSSSFTNSAFTNAWYRRDGGQIFLRADLTFSGAPTSSGSGATGFFVLLMPPSFLPNVSIINATNERIMGRGDHRAAGVGRGPLNVVMHTTATVLGYLALAFKSALSVSAMGSSSPAIWATGDRITFEVTYPVSTWTENKG